ncbi:DUF4855 domain-containing protein [Pseudobacillus wudalianchiensis]|uniref:SLH domain-containing protein n=1 Tax=Pseudobacillus wudalianchiensis TaxID=1743143 RepID=A0A1B9AYW6_9BACI|nr:DUF4855 domain-containing protein [Bacillus wudalianchiensis]OCA88943.1 hypothetical protein A8F95_05845 [Bacillus wudalianchiensis]
MNVLKTFLATILLVGAFATEAAAQTFKDVPYDHWAHDEIRFLTDKAVIRGYSDQSFKPQALLSRKDAAVMMVRALKLPPVSNPSIKPADLSPSLGGYKEMLTAANKGMFTIAGNKFNPNGPLTREEMARVLAVAYGYKGSGKSSFKDVSKSNAYYKYIDAIAENGITSGYPDGGFKPSVTVNRAQFSAFLKRVYEQPLDYAIKQNGQVVQTEKTMDKAIQTALRYPGSTVHPVSNSLMTYESRPAKLADTGIKNGVLMYNGAEYQSSFSSSFFKPYLQKDGQKMFDTFVILGRTYSGGDLMETSNNKANYGDWKWYADRTFSSSGILQALNKAAVENGQKVQVYIAIPYPKRNEAIINLDGKRTANTLQAREQMVNWYMQTVQQRWNAAKFQNLVFKGYYWLNETVIHADDERLVTNTAARIHQGNKKFIYAPHARTTNFENWKYYGFDGAYLQPNTFRLDVPSPEARLHKAFIEAQVKGSGITLEIDTYSPHQINKGTPNFLLYLEYARRYGLKGQSLLFYQGTEMVYRMDQYNYEQVYEALGEFLN